MKAGGKEIGRMPAKLMSRLVLQLMLKNGIISQKEHDELRNGPIPGTPEWEKLYGPRDLDDTGTED